MAESLTTSKMIVLILVALVIVVVLIFIFKPGWLDWIKQQLPEYKYSQEDEKIVEEDEKATVDCIKVAQIGDKDVGIIGDVRELFMCDIGNCNRKTGLHVDVDNPENYYIKVMVGRNIDVGEVKNGKAIINQEILNDYDANKKLQEYISYRDLIRLDNAKLFGVFVLCKTQEEIGKEKINLVVAYFTENKIPEISWRFGGKLMFFAEAFVIEDKGNKFYLEEGSNDKRGLLVSVLNSKEKIPYRTYNDYSFYSPTWSFFNRKALFVYINGLWYVMTDKAKEKSYNYEELLNIIGKKLQPAQ